MLAKKKKKKEKSRGRKHIHGKKKRWKVGGEREENISVSREIDGRTDRM